MQFLQHFYVFSYRVNVKDRIRDWALHHYTMVVTSVQSLNFAQFMITKIWTRQSDSYRPPTEPDNRGESNTPTSEVKLGVTLELQIE